ncbi:helix-turn-helix domain-containing protein [bacterium]|nr:helix-turn-helix domain-containing protein [bacterium]
MRKYAKDAKRVNDGKASYKYIHLKLHVDDKTVKHKQVLTTGDVANICKCSHDTVKRWLESEQLPGHRLPPHGQWRVLPKDLLDFMERHSIPIDEEASSLLGAPEPPIKDYIYCWEFHKRNRSHAAAEGKSCEDCLVFKTKAKDCFVLRKQAGPEQVLCQMPCDECDYYHCVMEMDELHGGAEA